jgi:predicted MFS family arabinose efflux permease
VTSLLARVVPTERPVRILAASTLISRVGSGIFMTVMALYFTRIVGFSALQVGLALTLAGAAGLVGSIPLGHLGDRRGAVGVMVSLQLATAVPHSRSSSPANGGSSPCSSASSLSSTGEPARSEGP